MSVIWHYTCDHGAPGIRRDGLVKPNGHPMLNGLPISWWTDLDWNQRFEVGLSSDRLSCDRMAYRFEVKEPSQLTRWTSAARVLGVPRAVRDELETGRLPVHWWVAFDAVQVIA